MFSALNPEQRARKDALREAKKVVKTGSHNPHPYEVERMATFILSGEFPPERVLDEDEDD